MTPDQGIFNEEKNFVNERSLAVSSSAVEPATTFLLKRYEALSSEFFSTFLIAVVSMREGQMLSHITVQSIGANMKQLFEIHSNIIFGITDASCHGRGAFFRQG